MSSFFRNVEMDDQRGAIVLPENRGQPGCTPAERKRFAAMVEAGRLTDVYRSMAPAGRKPNFTWRGTPGRDVPTAGRYYGKGMRIDHLLVSDLLLGAKPDEASGVDPTCVVPTLHYLGHAPSSIMSLLCPMRRNRLNFIQKPARSNPTTKSISRSNRQNNLIPPIQRQ